MQSSYTIIYLTLHKKWFDQILSGEKTIEYREVKPYYTKRFCPERGVCLRKKWFDPSKVKIIFKNGYSKTSPQLIARVKKIEIVEKSGKQYFAIHLFDVKTYANV